MNSLGKGLVCLSSDEIICVFLVVTFSNKLTETKTNPDWHTA